ncbi:PTS sugar transporter [Aggregatibacter actinomycetemcomitans]|uniref:Pts system, sucrose-specific iibc component n=1 Tax=Aggregatibacter actinomycetemcomitans serotype e str. SC1083 TaxID=907488 RepID=G4A930_AGGAC|nr:PTS system sucrose-specific transporter subunit IIBC [Aggregatibacter actinomycetemcomitans ANH9381]AMQ92167.1 PTS sugar transporter [Aggregatibacter actinomycetemcomitans]EGY33610.1 pts system, sucrose-specific iibc component [Aggregatibacter actinomycetemcomitans serotype e str. SC1083]KOE52061.1 PTS sugar transporter [Aggregatibacter actinomycetemcomitans serotype b str. S23A]KOE53146.1 PTS sugar transporter [Aggregatibacter actinomycetemcomitans serotype b str. I23C]KYK74119.1 PTS sugar
MNLLKIVQQVIEKLGDKGNIVTATHCAMRWRVVLNNESKVDKALTTLKV